MAATTGLSLTLDPMGTMFQNASSLKPLGQWNQTAHEWSLEGPLQSYCFFYVDRKFKMAATAGHRLTLDPIGKMFQNASSLKPLG